MLEDVRHPRTVERRGAERNAENKTKREPRSGGDLTLVTDIGRKEMFYDALNTFYLRLYGVGHMVKEGR